MRTPDAQLPPYPGTSKTRPNAPVIEPTRPPRETNQPRGPPDRVLRIREVAARTGVSRTTIWRLIKAGRFPQPFPLSSPSAVGWLEREVDEWIADRAARRPRSPEAAEAWRAEREAAATQNKA